MTEENLIEKFNIILDSNKIEFPEKAYLSDVLYKKNKDFILASLREMGMIFANLAYQIEALENDYYYLGTYNLQLIKSLKLDYNYLEMIIDKIGNALNLIEFGKLQLQNEETIEMGYKVVYRGYKQLINNYAVLYYHPIINNKLKEKGKLKK